MCNGNEDVEDKLDELRLAAELLTHWQAIEQQLFICNLEGVPRFPELRNACLRFMSYLIDQVDGLPKRCWFTAAMLLDVYCERKAASHQGINFNRLAATCLALVRLLSKSDDCDSAILCDSTCIEFALHLAEWLRSSGYATSADVTEHDVILEECELLRVLRWQLNAATSESWFVTWCARLSVRASSLVPSINWIWQVGVVMARNVVLRRAHSCEMLPRVLAAGVFSLSFAMAGLIAADSLRPRGVEASLWSEQVHYVLRQLDAPEPPRAELPDGGASTGTGELRDAPDETGHLMQLLEFGAGCNADVLVEGCGLVMGILLEPAPLIPFSASPVDTTAMRIVDPQAIESSLLDWIRAA